MFSVFWSLFTLGLDLVWRGNPSGNLKFFDILVNLGFAVLLLVSSLIFIVDAKQIKNLIASMHNYPQFTKGFNELGNESGNGGPFNIRQLYGTKITAAIFGIFQSLLHAVIVVNGFRGGRSTESYEAH